MIIAAWSGPRNLSTAMMYAFGNRPDFDAVDEPFYAAYLAYTGLTHPMQDAIMASQSTDARLVARAMEEPGKPHIYQKHMAHHMDGMPLGWAENCTHIHLIRHPARVIASYEAKRSAPTEADLGFAAQATLYDRLGGIVIDTSDLRDDPKGTLANLCAEIGLPWSDKMLQWPSGPKPYDGVWAPHWYGAVHGSTGFAGPESALPDVAQSDLLGACMPFYRAMKSQALNPAASR